MGIDDFKSTQPVFLPEQYFAGKLEGWAVLESLTGGLQRRARIAGEGESDGRTVFFRETYTFDDGHLDTLSWTIRKISEGTYRGNEATLVGEAVGEQAGCAFHWKYSRDVPQKGGTTTRLNFDDWFYLIDGRGCMVRGSAGRAGLPFATAHVAYRRL